MAPTLRADLEKSVGDLAITVESKNLQPEILPTIELDPLDRPVWGAEAIGQILNLTKNQVFYKAKRRLIDVDFCGRSIRSTPRRLLAPGDRTKA